MYNYSFNIALNNYQNTSTVYVWINGNIVTSFFKDRSLFPNKGGVSYNFKTNTTNNTICVTSEETWINPPSDYSATLVDDFSLILIPHQ
jgi:hypothetical protein